MKLCQIDKVTNPLKELKKLMQHQTYKTPQKYSLRITETTRLNKATPINIPKRVTLIPLPKSIG